MRHLKIALAAAAAIATLTVAASAGDMSGYYGNTVVCKYTNGDVTRVYINQDKTFTVVPTGHPQSSGTWADDGTNVCYTQTSPKPGPNDKQVCNTSALKHVGDTWDVTDPFGGHCTATLAAGKQ